MPTLLVICFFLFITLLLTSCTYTIESTTFEEVSQPYLDKYGLPEDIYKYDSDCYHTVDWWWWSKGFSVTFIDSCYDDVSGWGVDSEYSFPAF